MLAVVDKPLIQYAVEEAVAAGVQDLIFVTGRHKRAIEDHFDASPELESSWRPKAKTSCCMWCKTSCPSMSTVSLCACPAVGDEPFAVLLADDLMVGEVPITKQLVDVHAQTTGSVLAVQDVHANKPANKAWWPATV